MVLMSVFLLLFVRLLPEADFLADSQEGLGILFTTFLLVINSMSSLPLILERHFRWIENPWPIFT